MGVDKMGGFYLALFVMIMLINNDCCRAAFVMEKNTGFGCKGRLDECLIAEELEMEILMDSYVNRRFTPGPPVSSLTHICLNGGSVVACGGHAPYGPCVAHCSNHKCNARGATLYCKCN